jgi:hypothetical protein
MKQLFTGNHHSRALLKTACVESHPITRVDSACVDPYHSIATIGSGILTQESSWAHRLISRLRRSWLTRDNTLLPVSLERDESEQAEAGYEEPWFKALHVWRFEILACMVSLGSFLALIATAAAFSDRPLADWSLQFISINGVVAGLTVLVKGSLIVLITQSIGQAKWAWFSKQSTDGNGRVLSDLEMIDEVSRGPWGSAIWLFRHPLEINIVTIGATIVLLVSGIEYVLLKPPSPSGLISSIHCRYGLD